MVKGFFETWPRPLVCDWEAVAVVLVWSFRRAKVERNLRVAPEAPKDNFADAKKKILNSFAIETTRKKGGKIRFRF